MVGKVGLVFQSDLFYFMLVRGVKDSIEERVLFKYPEYLESLSDGGLVGGGAPGEEEVVQVEQD